MSKRHMARLIKKQRDIYIKRLRNSSIENIKQIDESEDHVLLTSSLLEEECESADIRHNGPTESFNEKLAQWYIRNKISRNAFEELLSLLRENGFDVPKKAETILPKIIDKPIIKNVNPGKYCHLGIRKQLQKIGQIFLGLDKIIIDLNIDGLPLFKSSRAQLWPILIRILNTQNVHIVPVGIYIGLKKPDSITTYLEDFIEEMKDINKNGILVAQHNYSLEIRAVVCDAPAKAFICGVPSHASLHGCPKCTQVGKKIGNTLTYCTKAGNLITDEDFKSRKYLKHHLANFQNNETPLETIGIKMISQLSIESMHLLHLGVMRKFILGVLQGKMLVNVSKSAKISMSEKLESLRTSIPKEFVRKARSFDDIANWKATEFRQFLLYTGFFVFKDEIPKIKRMPFCENKSTTENISCENCKQLSKKIDSLQETVSNLCKSVQEQNESIMSAFVEIKVVTTKLVRQDASIAAATNYFPVTSDQELENIEKQISCDNRDIYVSIMSKLWRNSVDKNLENILHSKIIMNYNLDGSHGKKRLKEFKNFYKVLIDSIISLPSLGQKDPEMVLRHSMQLSKKKQFRQQSALKKKPEELTKEDS